jgi:hypothetical protein
MRRGVHSANRRNMPPLINGREFLARRGTQSRVIAYQKNRVFPGCHVTFHFLEFPNGLNELSWPPQRALRARAGRPED